MVADAVVKMAKETLNFLVVRDSEKGGEVQGVITERHYVTYGAKVLSRARRHTRPRLLQRGPTPHSALPRRAFRPIAVVRRRDARPN